MDIPARPKATHSTPQNLKGSQLALLVGALLVTAIGQSFIFAILPPLGRDVGLTEIEIISIISTSALGFALSSALWGRISDRVGRKPILVFGLIAYTVGNLLFALTFEAGLSGMLVGAPLFAVALLVRCCQGVTMSATNPSATAYAADFTDRTNRTRVMARLGSASSFGWIIGPVLAGALAGYGLLLPLYFASILASIAVVVIALYLPGSNATTHGARPAKRLRVTDPRIRLFIGCSFAAFVGLSGIQQTLGFRLQDMLDLNSTKTAQYTGICIMASASMMFLMQMTVAQRYKGAPINLMRTGLTLMVVGIVGVTAAQQLVLIALSMGVMGSGLGLVAPAVSAAASMAVEPDEQGGVAGLITAGPAAAFVLGPLLCGYLYTLNPVLSSLAAAAIILLVLIPSLLQRRAAKKH